MSARLDYAAGGEAAWSGLEGDQADNAAMQPFSASSTQPWWQGVITYGITRAIDNRFGPTNVQGNTQPGSFAGQNGRTYTNRPTGAGGQVDAAGLGVPTWALLAAGLVVVYLVAKS